MATTPKKRQTTKKRLTFRLCAPEAKEVFVAGSFNDWDPQARALKRNKSGMWTTWMSLPPGTYEYRFVVDGEWCEDPECGESMENEHGSHNSVAVL